MAKIMNCCSLFHVAIALAWKECGAENFRNWGLRVLAACIKNQGSNVKHSFAVMFISVSAAETEGAGAHLAEKIKAGDVLALVGDLGAGKTQFVKGLARGLGSKEAVTSPTFTLLHEYRGGRLPIYHFDFYRIENLTALWAIGFDETVFGDGVSVIEWADRFGDAIPLHAHWIRFEIPSENQRKIDLAALA